MRVVRSSINTSTQDRAKFKKGPGRVGTWSYISLEWDVEGLASECSAELERPGALASTGTSRSL